MSAAITAPLTPSPVSEDMMRAIHGYIAMGWWLFPAQGTGVDAKKPHPGFKWKELASNDAETVISLMEKYPGSLLAGATGQKSGYFALDLDYGKGGGDETRASMAALIEAHGDDFKRTLTHSTPSGGGVGEHLIFSIQGVTEKLGNTAKTNFGLGIDSRGDGGYVVLPPSMIDGSPYGVKFYLGKIQKIPQWMIEVNSGRSTAPPHGTGADLRGPGPSRAPITLEAAQSLLHRKIVDVAEALLGSRNATLNRSAFVAGTLAAALGLADDDLTSKFIAACGVNGLVGGSGTREALATIRSGLDAGRRLPAPVAKGTTADDIATQSGLDLPDYLRDRLADPDVAAGVARRQLERLVTTTDREIEELRRPREPAQFATLDVILAREVTEKWRIKDLWPDGGHLSVIAPRKTGKTTLFANLIRSLLTGDAFLDRFEVNAIEGDILFRNYEVVEHQVGAWMADLNIPRKHHKRIHVISLRGFDNPYRTENGQEKQSQYCLDHGIEISIDDPFSRAFVGKNQQDNTDVAAFHAIVAQVAKNGGVKETAMSVHSGWGNKDDPGVRSRGASELEDFPDSMLYLSQKKETQVRYLSALGRDVDVEEGRLDFDPDTRHLTMSGGSRADDTRRAKTGALTEPILAIIGGCQGIASGGIEQEIRTKYPAVRLGNSDVKRTLDQLVGAGKILRFKAGSRRINHYTPGHVPPMFKDATPV